MNKLVAWPATIAASLLISMGIQMIPLTFETQAALNCRSYEVQFQAKKDMSKKAGKGVELLTLPNGGFWGHDPRSARNGAAYNGYNRTCNFVGRTTDGKVVTSGELGVSYGYGSYGATFVKKPRDANKDNEKGKKEKKCQIKKGRLVCP